MEINSTGITKSSLTDYLTFWTTKLREVYGNNFVIRPQGVVDNLATSSSLTNLALEDVIMFLAKQYNPYTAEGEFQDELYSHVGLIRKYATYTTVTRTISGTVGLECPIGSIRFKNDATDDIFELNTALTIGLDGMAVGSFTAIELGAIDLEGDADLSIIDAPEGITGVYYVPTENVTDVGDNYEDDSQFRARWIATNSIKSGTATSGGLRSALLELVNANPKNLNIRQNRNTQEYDDFPTHTLSITIKSSESDNTIAQTILENVVDGVGLYGDITVTLQDSQGTDVDISFSRATLIPIYFKIELVLKTNYTLELVLNNIKKAIVDNFEYSMGEKVVSNDFYRYINEVNGVDYVTNLEIKTGESGMSWGQIVDLNYNEFATVDKNNITVIEAE